MATTRDLLATLDEFERTPESRGYDLRLDLSQIVIEGLRSKGWSQAQLAAAMGVKPSFVTRIIHAAANCTFDTAGKIFFALDIRPKLAIGISTNPAARAEMSKSIATANIMTLNKTGTTHGKETIKRGSTSDPAASKIFFSRTRDTQDRDKANVS